MIQSFNKRLSPMVLLMAVLLVGLGVSTVAAASELSPTEPLAAEAKVVADESVRVDAAGLPRLAFDQEGETQGFECIRCDCDFYATPPTTRVGATCLRARQNAAAAARALAVCDSSTGGSCGPVTHSVAPCVPLSTGGFSATATAYFECYRCEDLCH